MKREPRELVMFNLSFLDVICCALGALILLFVITSQHLNKTVSQAVERYEEEAKKVSFAVQKYREEATRANSAADTAERMELRMREARQQAEIQELAALESRKLAETNMQQALASSIRAEKLEKIAQEENAQLKQTLKELEETTQKRQLAVQEINALRQQLETLQKALGEQSSEQGKLSAELTKSEEQLQSLLEKTGDEQTKLIQELRVLRDSNGKKDAELEEIRKEKRLLAQQLEELTKDLSRSSEKVETVKSMEADREQQLHLAQRKIQKLEEQLKVLGKKSIFGIEPRYSRVVFLVDRSGSIVHSKIKPVIIDTFSQVLSHCEIDEFALIAFSSNMYFYPIRQGTMLDGRDEHKKEVAQWYENQSFTGQTNIRQAIKHAYEDYGNLDAIFILTDGLPREGNKEATPGIIEDIKRYVKAKVQEQKTQAVKTRIITISIGVPPDEHKEVYEFLHSLSELTEGQYLGR
jgi:chemotaxis protein histidine kinase CheA